MQVFQCQVFSDICNSKYSVPVQIEDCFNKSDISYLKPAGLLIILIHSFKASSGSHSQLVSCSRACGLILPSI